MSRDRAGGAVGIGVWAVLAGAWVASADGDTDQADLGILLANWGAGCP